MNRKKKIIDDSDSEPSIELEPKRAKKSRTPSKKKKKSMDVEEFLKQERKKGKVLTFSSGDEQPQKKSPSSKRGSAKRKQPPPGNLSIDVFFKKPSSEKNTHLEEKKEKEKKTEPSPRRLMDPLNYFKATTSSHKEKSKKEKTPEPAKKKAAQEQLKSEKNEQVSVAKASQSSRKSKTKKGENKEIASQPKVSQNSQKKSAGRKSRDPSPLTNDIMMKLLTDSDQELIPKPSARKKTKTKPLSPSNSKAMRKAIDNSDGLNALEGLSFVITGVFDNADREEVIKFIKRLGGRVPGTVSKKTNYLVIGSHLERNDRPVTSTNKYKKADELEVPILTQEKLEELLRDLLKYPQFELSHCMGEIDKIARPELREETKLEETKYPQEPPKIKKAKIEEEKKANHTREELPALWVDKYKPQSAADLIGNRGVIISLREWLQDWDRVHILGEKKAAQFSRGMSYQQAIKVNSKAALLSGPPGIGKTSAAVIIANELGYEVTVTNASEKRNKNTVNLFIKAASYSTAIDSYFHKPSEPSHSSKLKRVIVMDEVDGMGGSDRGGIQALIQIIKETKTPIICICNDRQHQKIRSLANYCYDLPFARPTKGHIIKRMVEIVKKETGREPDKEEIERLVQSSGNDVRQVINSLQFSASKNQGLKDPTVMLTGFNAAGKLLNYASSEQSIKDKLDLFFVDYDLIPLLIQESYCRSYDERSHAAKDLKALSRAADSISLGEVYSTAIRSEQEWQLLPNFGLAAAVAPPCFKAYSENPQRGHVPYPAFPSWFGKNMTLRKNKRLISEVRAHLGRKISCGDMDTAQLIVPVLNKSIMDVFDDPERVLEILEYYDISMDMFKEHLMDLEYDGVAKSRFGNLTATVKTKMTKLYNKIHQQNFKQVKKKIVIGKEQLIIEQDEEGLLDEGDPEGGESEESEEEEIKITSKAKKTTKRVAVTQKKKTPTTKKKSKKRNSFIDDDDSEMEFSQKKGKKKGKKGKKVIDSSSDDLFDL